MKKFIYLPFIALIILTGCKSNSFNSQRYTKFGHASHKQSSHEVVVATKKTTPLAKEIVETEIVKNAETPIQLVASGISSLKESILKPERKVYSLNTSSAVNENNSESISKDESLSDKNLNTRVTSQKSMSQTQHSRGFVGSAFATALWIVLVVIFICLIIFLLAAIF